MKYFWVMVLCLFSFTSMGQQISPMFYKEILLKHKPYTLQSITEEIQSQSGISFSYNTANINPDTRIRIKGDRMTVAEILALIKKQKGISYKIISQRHIIYTVEPGKKNKKQSGSKRIKQQATQPKQSTEDSLSTDEPVVAGGAFGSGKTTTITDSTTDDTIIIVGDSGAVASYYYNGGGGSGDGDSGNSGSGNQNSNTNSKSSNNSSGNNKAKSETAGRISERKWRREAANRNYRNNGNSTTSNVLNFFENNTLLAVGASVDETYYLNPTLKFGMNFIYGIASYNIGNGKGSWRYGIGGSAKIDEHWSMHFVITTGQSVSKDYSIPNADTSMPDIPLTATSRLTRYGLSINYNMGRGLAIEAGTTFNLLKTNYTSNGSPVTLSDVLPIGYDADKKYPGIKPPYTLGNSYTGSSTGNTKTWLGIQLTLLYQFRFADNRL